MKENKPRKLCQWDYQRNYREDETLILDPVQVLFGDDGVLLFMNLSATDLRMLIECQNDQIWRWSKGKNWPSPKYLLKTLYRVLEEGWKLKKEIQSLKAQNRELLDGIVRQSSDSKGSDNLPERAADRHPVKS